MRAQTPRLRLSLKIGLALFLVVVGALGIVYLAVVPRLESRLVGAKIRELERSAPSVVTEVERADPFGGYQNIASFFGSSLNARIVIFDRLNESAILALDDSSGLSSADVQRDPVGLETARTGLPASGRVTRGDHEFAEVAMPAGPTRIVLLSASLRDALANVNLVQRSLLLSGLAALLVSWAAGYLAAWRFSRRLRRLERAADRIASGDFDVPVHDPVQDEVGQLAQAFDSMRVRLAHLDHARREFIANASHELRTPIFSLGGFVELLEHEEPDRASREEFVREMRGQIERLTKLTADLLDLSKLDADAIELHAEPVELKSLAELVAAEFRPAAERHSSKLDVADGTGPALARGDPDRVAQIIRILLDNALTHTREGTAISVTTMQGDGTAGLVVTDTGAGIDPRTRGRVFERFYTGDSVSGSGLGLAIARELAMRMDGSLRVESRRGHTEFTLELPGGRAAATPAGPT